MSTNVKAAKNRIINALGDLYRVERHSSSMSAAQKRSVKDAIVALEAEYTALLPSLDTVDYADVAEHLNTAKGDLEAIRDERVALANAFVSATKILGSISQILKLI